MSFPAYPDYRDSGVSWVGKVPKHWDVPALKRRVAIVGGSTPKSDVDDFWDGDIPWVTPADLSRLADFYINDAIRCITAEGLASCGTTMVPAGSVILSTRAPIGSLGIAAVDLCTNQGCKALVPSSADSKFLAYLLSICSAELNVRGRGSTFLELSGDELGAFALPFPCLNEQTAIAAFLDRETAKIDALVAEQERLIALLKEKRQAVISHAVTKGLNPHAPMKDSGIEWLGEIPAHWEVVGLTRLTTVIQTGPFGSQLHAEDYVEDQVPVINPSNLRAGLIVPDLKNTVTEEMADTLGQHRLSTGEIILARRGEMGRCAVVSDDDVGALCGTGCLRISLESTAEPSFIATYLATPFVVEKLKLNSVGATMDNLNASIVAKIPTPRPPAAEQREIMRKLHAASEGFDTLTAEAQSAITLLQERRAALISAAVTGKIDVRGLVDAPAEMEAA